MAALIFELSKCLLARVRKAVLARLVNIDADAGRRASPPAWD